MTDVRVLCDYGDDNLPPYGIHTHEEEELDNDGFDELPFHIRFDNRSAVILGIIGVAGVLTILKASAKIGKKLLS